ncbi:hypothetical protein TBLA_0A06810 [Henningerozyma blattae CBS 6284]|uniref:Uncharacterized protein n=1 Tax=Henningerozyma blattae (strain ATCC 34711 / CBS 6284 / DSM 70876 / NBRC 10599 / NRRL Y-10934 / UCD 77-7) TaxID=1071380 RepID=I2GWH1_HENB6|nr:hypothetical protein TBLA_0A06810 [Tetrapisispora blattae CBS 6284]CCH58473.1 hypothetical protein TBLA_0A06810 [Tetrapisispora blattae CBS 6284]
MSLTTGGGLHQEVQECITQMELLKVTELKMLCRSTDLSVSGRKSQLQDRLRHFLRSSIAIGHIDPWRPKAVKILIEKAKLGDTLPAYDTLWNSLKSGAFRHPVASGYQPPSTLQNVTAASPSRYNRFHISSSQHNQSTSGSSAGPNPFVTSSTSRTVTTTLSAGGKKKYDITILHFKESPFYQIKKLIPESVHKLNITENRGVTNFKFKFEQADWNLLSSNKSIQLFLFCGVINTLGSQGNEYIQFPHPNEIKVNNVQIKENVRGIKNKVGTAKPANLTKYLKAYPAVNSVEVVYAFTKVVYGIYCYLVEEISPETLLQQYILKNQKLLKASTLQYIKDMLKEDEEAGLITTSTVMSLQCPISYTRMKYPAKSIQCRHLQCFDAVWYLYSQEQIPTWLCPVCQKPIKFSDISICEFVDSILKNCVEDVEQVEISPDGSWVPIEEEELPHKERQNSGKNETTSPEVKKETSQSTIESSTTSNLHNNTDHSPSDFPRASNHEEPIIIDLDSDDDDENEASPNTTTNNTSSAVTNPPAESPQKAPLQSNPTAVLTNELPETVTSTINESSNISASSNVPTTSFIDHSNSSVMASVPATDRSLDPRANSNNSNGSNGSTFVPASNSSIGITNTPSNRNTLLNNSETSRNFVNPQEHRISVPNILGTTPLNITTNARRRDDEDDDDLPLRDPRIDTPTPNRTPQENRSNTENQQRKSFPTSSINTETLSVENSVNNGRSTSNSLPNLNVSANSPVGSDLPLAQQNALNTMLSNGHTAGNSGTIEPNSNRNTYINTQTIQSTSTATNAALPPLGRVPDIWQSSNSNLLGISGDFPVIRNLVNISNTNTSNNNIPPLPPLPTDSNNSSNPVRNVSTGRVRKPVVSPFIPKRPHPPQQKRTTDGSVSLYNGGMDGDSSSNPHNRGTNPNPTLNEPSNALYLGVSIDNNDDIIVDLTSD